MKVVLMCIIAVAQCSFDITVPVTIHEDSLESQISLGDKQVYSTYPLT